MVSQLRRKLAERVRGNAALWHRRGVLSPQFVPPGPRQGAVACRPRARRVTSQSRTRQGGMDKSRGRGGHHISSRMTSSRTLIREPAALKDRRIQPVWETDRTKGGRDKRARLLPHNQCASTAGRWPSCSIVPPVGPVRDDSSLNRVDDSTTSATVNVVASRHVLLWDRPASRQPPTPGGNARPPRGISSGARRGCLCQARSPSPHRSTCWRHAAGWRSSRPARCDNGGYRRCGP